MQIGCFNDKKPCPGYALVDTKDAPDRDEYWKQRVDACLYLADDTTPCVDDDEDTRNSNTDDDISSDDSDILNYDPDVPEDDSTDEDYDPDESNCARKVQRPHWGLHRLHIEFKGGIQFDAFNDEKNEFEGPSKVSQKTRAQIISYAALVFKYQHRAFLFTLLVLGPYARIIRWDRAGAVVTERFNYEEDPTILNEFFWRFSQMNPMEQGMDTSATIATDSERTLMREAASDENVLDFRDYARVYFAASLSTMRQWWKVSVQDPNTSETKFFLIGAPRFNAGGVAGRGTRGYVALDLEYIKENPKSNSCRKFVWLKDAWRVDHDGILQEGLILQELNDQGVTNVPTLLCHGDVLEQRTVTQDCCSGAKPDENPIRTHAHYRMVVREVGRPFESFKSGHELALILFDCITGEFK